MDTQYKINKYFTEKFSFVKQKESFLDHRSETVRKDGQMKQIWAADTYQFISIIETLTFLFKHKEMQDLFLQNKKSTDDKMRDYCDGSQLAMHSLCGYLERFLQTNSVSFA